MAAWFDVYCDESDTHGANTFWIGALICSPRRADILVQKICDLREKYNHFSEFKWSKLKKHNFRIYEEFINIFFKDKFIKLTLMQFTKNDIWNKWENNNKKRMAKCYYCFLSGITKHYCKYNVYGDQLFHDYGTSFAKINNLLNEKRKQEWMKKGQNILNMIEVNSSEYELIQLTDVLMGAYRASICTNLTKLKISKYVKELLSENTRFSIIPWTFTNSLH